MGIRNLMSKIKSKNKLSAEQKKAQLELKLRQEKALAERKEKVKLLRVKARELHDILSADNKSIEATKQIVSAIGMEIDRIFNEKRLKTNVSELDIKVATGAEEQDVLVKKILAVVADQNVTDATQLFSAMGNVIDAIIRKRNQETKFSEIAKELGDALVQDDKAKQ